MALLEICCGYASLKDDLELVFDGTAPTKAALFMVMGEILPESPLLERASQPE